MLCWVAVYSDGSTLSQYNGDGSENKYADIDRPRLVEFRLMEIERLDEQERPVFFDGRPHVLRHALILDPGQRLIYRRRTQIQVSGKTRVFHLVGWQMTVEGHNVQSITYVPDCEGCNATIAAGRFREDGPLLSSIEPYAWERELGVEVGP
jgi:hypothetical protein